MPALIAFDTSTERMSVALRCGERVVAREGEGGARASATLLPTVLDVLAEAGIALADLDAIAFGRGPGAFTGLRTSCAVAQGLALGSGKPVLPIDTLLAVAEDARGAAADVRIWALLDARMEQIYAAEYAHADGRWTTLVAPSSTNWPARSPATWTKSTNTADVPTASSGARRSRRSRRGGPASPRRPRSRSCPRA